MRPAHQAREVRLTPRIGLKSSPASMRPAHQAREVKRTDARGRVCGRSFNEARASSAGSNGVRRFPRPPASIASMRPAHQAREVKGSPPRRESRRRASMRPAHQAREVTPPKGNLAFGNGASMRPAHQAREVRTGCGPRSPGARRFNEARASSAGSKRQGARLCGWRPSFNEARASSAGSNAAKRGPRPSPSTLQ